MAATKWVYVVLLMLLLSWWGSVCFANRDINDKNQQVDKQEGSGSGYGSGVGSGFGSGSGTSGGLGCGSGTGSGSGHGSGTGSGEGCGTGGKGSGTGSGSGFGQGSGGCGSGCTGSGQASGIPSFQIPGLPPIPLYGLHCTPIGCPAGNCGGVRMFFDYSQRTANLHANQETKTHEANQGSNTHYDRQILNDKLSSESVVTHELKRSTHGSINSDEAKDYSHDQTLIASPPRPS
ncbi:hypothetical protein FNV43_RR07586 [Rhamnella rubrinervis]|uniref:Uncharacterized protein n=1 Tax=Rhamnella rubrinervis TaxID=2594499 RepID=A0A8K0MMB6_9ROSA|nr:hypothetical protein FNV43_RR07586 [Rhamnella rubrinervis]